MDYRNKSKKELIIELNKLHQKYDSLNELYNTDITEHKQAENTLHESEDRFRKIVEQAPIAMAVVSMDGVIEFINHKTVEVFGYLLEDIPTMDRWWLQAYPDKVYRKVVVANWMGRIQKALTEGNEIVGNEYQVTCKNGDIKMMFISGVPVSNKIFVLFDDITERKRAEEELKKTLERLDLATNAAHLGIWDWDIPKNELVWDDRMYELYGIKREDFSGAYEAWLAGIHPDDRSASNEISQQSQRGEREYDTEFRVVWPDGTIHHLKAHGLTVRDQNGKPLRMTGINYDITERKQAEEALKGSQERYRLLHEYAPVGILLVNRSGQILKVNSAAIQILGSPSPEATKGINLLTFPLLIKAGISAAFQRCIETGQVVVGEYLYISNWGKSIQAKLQLVPISDDHNQVNLVHTIIEDITERKRAEEALHESEQHYKMISELATDYVYKLSVAADCKVTMDFVSDNFYSLTGRTKEDAMTVESWSSIIHPDDLGKVKILLQKLIAKPQSNELELRSYIHGHKLRWVHTISRSEWDEKENRVTTIVGAVTDITERKQAEILLKEESDKIEAQNQKYIQLNEELNQTNKKLQLAKEKAEESDHLKTAFLQNMSHEIRTPMNAIVGFSELLATSYDDKPRLEMFSEIINQRCNDLLDIINDILDIAKIESGQLPVNIEECNLNKLFDELTSFFKEYQKRIGKQQILFSLQTHCDPSENVIATDRVKLKQIFINLIGNAFKFTEKGKIECGCKIDANQKLIFYVSDTGIGIPPDKYEVIFERFTQLNHETNLAFGGTGLGLSIVKGLIDLLGGKIWVESELENLPAGKSGKTTFYFSIPYRILPSSHNESELIEENHALHFSGKTILVVEDDPYNVRYIKEILSKTGLNIIYTAYGKEAVQIATSQTLDLVLLDIRLPDMNGYEAVQQIKLHKPNLKFIAQTAYAAQEDRQRAFDAGCIDYISKPLKHDLLLSMLNKHLSKQ